FEKPFVEGDIENKLIDNITKFLLELGKGFAYVGKQYHLEIVGKLNFYISAVDTLLKKDGDNPTIGILLCRDKNNIEVEFALRDINKPIGVIGVSEFELTEVLPENLKSSLPTIKEIKEEFNE
ncbi:MAG: PDDEXK nuclease domain-containing protein, partial [Campylobacterota bacterium]|nr:PDDEXK nuclease domain-containing protein [Campylobacterota bacterium]